MRILVLNYEFPPIGGGGGAVSRDLGIELAKRGHEVTVVTMHHKELPYKEEIEGITVYRVKCMRKYKGVCYPWEQLTYILSAIHFLNTELWGQKFDICHAHFIIPTGVAARYLKQKYGLPYIITAHGSDVEGYNQKRFKIMHKLLRPFWKKIVRDAKAVIAPSVFLENLMKNSDPEREYSLIPNGIDAAYYTTLAGKYKKTKSLIVLCRMQVTKGVQDVIRAFSLIKSKDWKLKAVGDGPYLDELKLLAEELGIGERVEFYGWVENKGSQYEELLGESYLYVSGSRFENCPMSVLEAMAAGCQVLVSDIPAHRQLIEKEASFFPCGDVTVLAEKIQREIDQYEKGIDGVFDIQLQKYDWKQIGDEYERIMQS